MPTPISTQEAIARGEDLRDLLDHIAWTDTIVPELNKLRDLYSRLLVQSVLGQKISITSYGQQVELSAEQLAGKIAGINFIEELMKKVLTRGVIAFEEYSKISSR